MSVLVAFIVLFIGTIFSPKLASIINKVVSNVKEYIDKNKISRHQNGKMMAKVSK